MIVGQMGILMRLWYAKEDGIDIYNPYVQINIIHFYLFTILAIRLKVDFSLIFLTRVEDEDVEKMFLGCVLQLHRLFM